MTKSITIVISSLRRGGAELSAIQLAENLINWGWDVSIITILPSERPDNLNQQVQVDSINIDSRKLGMLRKAISIVYIIKSLRKKLINNKPNLIISYMTETNLFMLVSSIGLSAKKIVAERIHPDYSFEINNKILLIILKSVRNLIYLFATKITVQSESMKKALSSFLRDKVVVIPNTLRFNNEYREVGHSKVILSIGRLVPQKNFALLIKAFSHIADKFSDWKLKIVGEGVLFSELNSQIESLNLKSRISICPPLADPTKYFEEAEIFCLTSNYEGFPNVLLEAMNFSLPVISTNSLGAVSDLVVNEKSGLLVKCESSLEVAEALERLINDVDFKEKIRKEAHLTSKNYLPSQVDVLWKGLIDTMFESY